MEPYLNTGLFYLYIKGGVWGITITDVLYQTSTVPILLQMLIMSTWRAGWSGSGYERVGRGGTGTFGRRI